MTPTDTLETTDLTDAVVVAEPVETAADGVLEDLLVEEVSIDGMCGVY